MIYFKTKNLIFRDWNASDLEYLIELNKESGTFGYYQDKMTANESVKFYEKVKNDIENNGYGLYAVELASTGSFIGFMGFISYIDKVSKGHSIFISWKLYTGFLWSEVIEEGARKYLEYGINDLKFNEIHGISFYEDEFCLNIIKKIGMKKKTL